jgi:HD-GYP domain-containing protein (c-di-GMP phosphodiesterase class II)
LLESSTHKDIKESAKDLLRAYQDSINKVPEGVIEYFIAWRRDGRLVTLLYERGDPNAKRHPEKFYLIDDKGNPVYISSEQKVAPILDKALDGQQGVVELEETKRGDVIVAYSPLQLAEVRLGLLVGVPLGPIKRAMLRQGLLILLLALVLIAMGVWVFLRLNPMLAELSHSQEAAVQMLGEASHFKDTDTGWHVERMSDYAVAIAKAMNLPPKELMMLKLAARMHDLGKVGTPDDVLKKPGKLDDEEWVVMREHSAVGAQIMAGGETPVFEMAREIAVGHHEKWDGGGYPQKRSGEQIPLVARITAVADVFDALTMKRPYKEPWPIEKAFSVIQEDAGSHFDPEVVKAFMSIKEEILAIKDQWEAKEKASTQV